MNASRAEKNRDQGLTTPIPRSTLGHHRTERKTMDETRQVRYPRPRAEQVDETITATSKMADGWYALHLYYLDNNTYHECERNGPFETREEADAVNETRPGDFRFRG